MKPVRFLLFIVCAIAPLLHAATVRLGSEVVPVSQSVRLELDPRRDDYRGSVSVDLEVKKATASFRFHAVVLAIESLALADANGSVEAAHEPGEDGTVVVTTAQPLEPGRATLTIDFTNAFNRQAVGLYKLVAAAGEPYLFTQFQAVDGRRAFPMWDEPGIKIPYALTIEIPNELDAVANTPIVEENAGETTKRIRFATTKPIPSYLVALAVGRFDFTPIEGMSVPGRVVAPKGQGHLSALAASVTPRVLAALETYFGSTHPFEKVDVIAVPDFWAGAMENAGAITFRDTILLLDPATATPAQRQNLVRIVAHELAHMWFGNLVTMQWWDDFWLNECFADWMGDKITHRLHPEFDHDLDEMQSIQFIMGLDARATTDPIRNPNTTPEEAMRNVGLAYNKGKAILSMFEAWIGPEEFRQGVLAHLEANAWGNADAAKFFHALGRRAPKGTVAALDSFISQPGLPLVTVEQAGRSSIRLSQRRFASGSAVAPMTWRIPVAIRWSDGRSVRTASVLLDAPSKSVRLRGARIEWIFPDAGGNGYYRWKTTPEAMTSLAESSVAALTPRERLAFLGNLGALFRSGAIRGDLYLDLLARFAADPHDQVLSTSLTELSTIRETFDSEETRADFARYVRRILDPAFERIGLTPREEEAAGTTSLRPLLLGWLADPGADERIWEWIAEEHPRFMNDPAAVHPSLRWLVITLGARRGDAALFDEYQKRFESAPPAERNRFLSGLARFRDPELRRRAREYAFSGNVRANELFTLWGDPTTAAERDDLYAWITEHYDEITGRLPPAFAAGMPYIAAGCEPERVERARTFFADRKVEGTDRQLARVAEQVSECAALRQREMAAVTEYLKR